MTVMSICKSPYLKKLSKEISWRIMSKWPSCFNLHLTYESLFRENIILTSGPGQLKEGPSPYWSSSNCGVAIHHPIYSLTRLKIAVVVKDVLVLPLDSFKAQVVRQPLKVTPLCKPHLWPRSWCDREICFSDHLHVGQLIKKPPHNQPTKSQLLLKYTCQWKDMVKSCIVEGIKIIWWSIMLLGGL